VDAVTGEATRLEGGVLEAAKKDKSVISRNAYFQRQRRQLVEPASVEPITCADENSHADEEDEVYEAVILKRNPETDLNTANNKRKKTSNLPEAALNRFTLFQPNVIPTHVIPNAEVEITRENVGDIDRLRTLQNVAVIKLEL
jgi:hypothetical protein